MYTLITSIEQKAASRLALLNAKVVSLILPALLVGGCGSMGSDPDFQQGFYVAGGVGVSRLTPNTKKNSTFSLNETNSEGGQFALGYDLSSRVSVEGHVAELGEATLNPQGSIGYQEMGLSALIYALNDRFDRNERIGFSGYGRIGGGAMKNQSDTVPFERLNDMSLLAGVGLEYGFRNGLALRGEVIAFDEDAQYGQLGLVYRFGERDMGGRSSTRPEPVVNTEPEELPELVELPETVAMPADGDFDGVADAMDACPNTAPGKTVGADGCILFNGVLEGVNFETSSAQLTAEAEAVLEDAAITLQSKPDVRILIEAHTDNQGSAVSNLELSRQRAISVARFLVNRGINPQRLQPQAFGESNPRASNRTADGRRQNRRVEFKVLD